MPNISDAYGVEAHFQSRFGYPIVIARRETVHYHDPIDCLGGFADIAVIPFFSVAGSAESIPDSCDDYSQIRCVRVLVKNQLWLGVH